eukprot:3039493-Rhodomonas_salina.1
MSVLSLTERKRPETPRPHAKSVRLCESGGSFPCLHASHAACPTAYNSNNPTTTGTGDGRRVRAEPARGLIGARRGLCHAAPAELALGPTPLRSTLSLPSAVRQRRSARPPIKRRTRSVQKTDSRFRRDQVRAGNVVPQCSRRMPKSCMSRDGICDAVSSR